jgi:riboflavin kinase/FMN adenylyltransferase
MSVPHRLLVLERMGVSACILRPFDRALAAMTPEQFLVKDLLGRIGIRGIVLGHDATFGKGRAGTIDTLRKLAKCRHIEVHACEPVKLGNQPVSSTMIRQAILAGELDRAAAMLGRPVSTLGTVVEGTGRGRTLGFPTANLDVHNETYLPRGVYGAVVRVLEPAEDGLIHVSSRVRDYNAVVNIGVCPTFGSSSGQANPVVEAHILEFCEDIYGRDVEVEYLFCIRDERRFDSPAALQAQVEEDIAVLRDRLKGTPPRHAELEKT